jgi:amino acid transporter/mannitol/fructose-specific phosphotransferase system IIA component (Ntr-type)
MAILDTSRRLRKELGLLEVYAIATGTTLSAGFFLLPGLAAAAAGPAVVLSYLLAVLPLLPATLCMVELATAMPRAGGTYYFLDRSMGPLLGTIGGLGTWLTLVLKTAFALIGMGAYLNLLLGIPDRWMVPVALGLALLFGVLNLFGSRKSGGLQILLVLGLLTILGWFIASGLPVVHRDHLAGFTDQGFDAIFATAGLVYISYVGVTKVASLSEEVRNPERTLPLGVFLSLATTVVVYGLGILVMVGTLPPEQLHASLTPAADAAGVVTGARWGQVVVAVAALCAFFAVANAGILSASRYPLAMSRDHLLPRFLRALDRRKTPWVCVCCTVGLILLCLILLDVTRIAKLASSFQLLMFALICLAVIVMRESRIPSYDPGFRTPLYPYVPIAGVLLPFLFIAEMGWLPILFTLALLGLGAGWYHGYARRRLHRSGALLHVFARLGHGRYEGLDSELRSILKEKGLRAGDPYDQVITQAQVLDLQGTMTFEEVTRMASRILAQTLPETAERLAEAFLQGTAVGATPVAHGVALPHFRHQALRDPRMVLVRSREGIAIDQPDPFATEPGDTTPLHAIFYLISPEEDHARHLRILAQLARHVDDDDFQSQWREARDESALKQILLREERFLTLDLKRDGNAMPLIDRELRNLDFPAGCLVALIRRQGETIIPGGDTRLQGGDHLTVIGDPRGLTELRRMYGAAPARAPEGEASTPAPDP